MRQLAADSDIRMLIATQVSYLDGTPGVPAGALVARTIARCEGRSDLSEQEKDQLETARYIQSKIEEHGLSDCRRWIIREAANDNAKSGFYGCLIDTRDGDAILAMRGSESFDRRQVLHDWVEADVGLMNSTGTRQQRRAEEFTRYIHNTYGTAYRRYSFTGHSLGGNLAEHAAITAPAGMPIRRCLSLDGPGFSYEYAAAHSESIPKRGRYVDHYHYSFVGALLLPLPGTNYRTIAAHNDKEAAGLSAFIRRHHTRNIEFDESGSVKPGKCDALSMIAGPLSKRLDAMNFSPLWLICPQIALARAISQGGRTVLLGMKSQARHLIDFIRETQQNV